MAVARRRARVCPQGLTQPGRYWVMLRKTQPLTHLKLVTFKVDTRHEQKERDEAQTAPDRLPGPDVLALLGQIASKEPQVSRPFAGQHVLHRVIQLPGLGGDGIQRLN